MSRPVALVLGAILVVIGPIVAIVGIALIVRTQRSKPQ